MLINITTNEQKYNNNEIQEWKQREIKRMKEKIT